MERTTRSSILSLETFFSPKDVLVDFMQSCQAGQGEPRAGTGAWPNLKRILLRMLL